MFIWKEDGDFIRTMAGWWIINRESVKLGESVSKMCKQPSNFNNGEKYEKRFERVQYRKRGINLLWRELVGLVMFVVQLQKKLLPFLYRLCTLQPLCPPWLQALNGWKLGFSVPRGGYWERILSNPLYFFSPFLFCPPLEAQQLCLLCSPCSSTIGNAARARSKPRSVLKLSP